MIEVRFTGKILTKKLESFTSQASGKTISKCEVVLTNSTPSGFIDTLACICFDEEAEKINSLPEGTMLSIRGSVSSREWKEKYYTNVNVLNWDVTEEEQPTPTAQVEEPKQQKKKEEQPQMFAPQAKDDLPF